MSRCFPYPPPGYVRNGASGGTLIDSIKLQKVKEKAEVERKKEGKREKKEKKSEEKEKRREKHGVCNSDGKDKRLGNKCHQADRSWVDSKERHLQKKTEDVAEQLEKSDLTEEHEQPNYSGNLCYSSDGTQSGSKRKRDSLPSNGNRSHGNIIRIRLPLVKHKEADTPLVKEQPCTKSGIAGSYCREISRSEIAQLSGQEQCCSTSTKANTVAKECTPRIDAESLPSTSGKTETLAVGNIGSALESKPIKSKMFRKETLYKALTENWDPASLHQERDDYDDDQQWLFEKKHPDNHSVKRLKGNNDFSCQDSSSLCPRAHYLPGADIYALPYTIPF